MHSLNQLCADSNAHFLAPFTSNALKLKQVNNGSYSLVGNNCKEYTNNAKVEAIYKQTSAAYNKEGSENLGHKHPAGVSASSYAASYNHISRFSEKVNANKC